VEFGRFLLELPFPPSGNWRVRIDNEGMLHLMFDSGVRLQIYFGTQNKLFKLIDWFYVPYSYEFFISMKFMPPGYLELYGVFNKASA
jgi:hypothetical protein